MSVTVEKLANPQPQPGEEQDTAAATVNAENGNRRPEEQPHPEAYRTPADSREAEVLTIQDV